MTVSLTDDNTRLAYLDARVRRDLNRLLEIAHDAVMTHVTGSDDVHIIPWDDEAALDAVAQSLSRLINSGTVHKQMTDALRRVAEHRR